jgi:hypothetical protein
MHIPLFPQLYAQHRLGNCKRECHYSEDDDTARTMAYFTSAMLPGS